MMRKILPKLIVATFTLLLSACADEVPGLNPKPTPPLPEVYATPFQQAVKNNTRMDNPMTFYQRPKS